MVAGLRLMCELLVRVVDKVNHSDPYANAKCTKRGDVIVVQRDGWPWGVQEQLDKQYRIVKVPGLSVDDASSLLAGEPEVDPQNPSRMLQARLFRLDLDAFDAATCTWLAEPRRNRKPMHKVGLTLAQLLALRVRKDALDDPNVL
jgi:hypothetical protein